MNHKKVQFLDAAFIMIVLFFFFISQPEMLSADNALNMGIIDERLSVFDFTMPNETFRISVFVRSSAVDVDEKTLLDERTVGVVSQNQGLAIMKKREILTIRLILT